MVGDRPHHIKVFSSSFGERGLGDRHDDDDSTSSSGRILKMRKENPENPENEEGEGILFRRRFAENDKESEDEGFVNESNQGHDIKISSATFGQRGRPFLEVHYTTSHPRNVEGK